MENYQIIRQIGKGSFGRVYLVKHKQERKRYCLKSIKLEGISASERKACQTEVNLLGKMLHPNIVGFKESFVARGGKLLCIVMTYCDGGDLADRLKQNGTRLFKEEQILHWFVQLALGLHFMHNMGDKCVLHRDLKTQNIFLLGNGRLVIGDLGISKALDESTDFTKTTIGTPYYMSPEVYKSRPYNHKSDVWALGCVLYEMITLKHAFNAKSLNGLMGKVVKGRFEPIPRVYSKHLSHLVDKMLELDPSKRPSLPEILSMPFIKKHICRFLAEIADRPSQLIGEGTMVLRKAALGVASGFGGDNLLEKQTKNLKKQLESLGMSEIVQRAFKPIASPPRQEDENRNVFQSPREPRARRELKKAAKDQKSALAIERERKRAVENALAKLRKERLMRANERKMKMERLREREQVDRLRQVQLRQKEAERRRAEIEQRRVAQKRANDRMRGYDNSEKAKSPVMRWKEKNPVLIAQAKARQFEKQYNKSPSKHEEEEKLDRMNARDRVMYLKEQRKQAVELEQRELLIKAAQDRRNELKSNANDMNMKHFHPQQYHQQQRQHDDVNLEEYAGEKRRSAWGTQQEVPSPQPLPISDVEDDDDEETETEIVIDDYESDHSSVPATSPKGNVNDKDHDDDADDDIDEKEEELKMELEHATMKCSSIKRNLKQFKAELKATQNLPIQPNSNNQQKDEDHESDSDADEEEEDDDDDDISDESWEITQKSEEKEKHPLSSSKSIEKTKVLSSNNNDDVCDDRGDDDSSSDESESSDDGLFSPVIEDVQDGGFVTAKRGGLQSRIQTLEEECIRALGKKRFEKVYRLLKTSLQNKLHENGENGSSDQALQKRMQSLLAGDGKLSYWNKIDNLIFMQEAIM